MSSISMENYGNEEKGLLISDSNEQTMKLTTELEIQNLQSLLDNIFMVSSTNEMKEAPNTKEDDQNNLMASAMAVTPQNISPLSTLDFMGSNDNNNEKEVLFNSNANEKIQNQGMHVLEVFCTFTNYTNYLPYD